MGANYCFGRFATDTILQFYGVEKDSFQTDKIYWCLFCEVRGFAHTICFPLVLHLLAQVLAQDRVVIYFIAHGLAIWMGGMCVIYLCMVPFLGVLGIAMNASKFYASAACAYVACFLSALPF